jgi:hypothetical protein
MDADDPVLGKYTKHCSTMQVTLDALQDAKDPREIVLSLVRALAIRHVSSIASSWVKIVQVPGV